MRLSKALSQAGLITVFICFSGSCLAAGITPPTGKYFVGTSKHVVPFTYNNDPAAPNNVSTSFLATIYYPTLQKPCNPPTPYLDPVVAQLWEQAWNYTASTLSSLTSQLQPNAPIAPAPEHGGTFPTLLFGPGGGGPPVETYAILLSELASRGYVIAGLDHPYEQPFVRYPNGTGIYGLDVNFNWPFDLAEAVYEMRVESNLFFLSSFWPSLVKQLNAPFATTRIGAFGHSIGGADALGAALQSSRDVVASALNMDGSMWGDTNDTAADARRPVMLLGQELHTPEGDSTWGIFPAAQSGWWRTILVDGTAHLDFSDATFWKRFGGPAFGSIDGDRMVEITREFVTSFFNMTISEQEESVLTDPGPEWADVKIYDGSNGTAGSW